MWYSSRGLKRWRYRMWHRRVLGWYKVEHQLGIRDPSAANNSPTKKHRPGEAKQPSGTAKRTNSIYQTNVKCSIHGKILWGVDQHPLTQLKRARYESAFTNMMNPSSSSVEEEESVSIIILLPMKNSECRWIIAPPCEMGGSDISGSIRPGKGVKNSKYGYNN